MGFEEIIGFIVSILAVIFLVGKTLYEFIFQKKELEESDQYNDEKDKSLRDFLRSLEGDMIEAEKEDRKTSGRKKGGKHPLLPPKVVKRRDVKRSDKSGQRPFQKYKDEFKYSPEFDSYKISKNAIEEYSADKLTKREELSSQELGSDVHFEGSTNAYDLTQKVSIARGRKLLNRYKSKQEAIILKEIIGKPKCYTI